MLVPSRISWFFVFGLAMCWLIVIFVDMLNFAGLGEQLIEMAARDGSAFVMLFGEARPVEWMQWLALGGAIMLASQVSLLKKQHSESSGAKFAFWMAILFIVLLMEDAGNLRHSISDVIVASGIPQPLFSNFYRMLVYVVYAAIPMYAILFHGRQVLSWKRNNIIFWSAVLAYAFASIMSVSAPLGNWYETVGASINDMFFGGRVAYELLSFDSGYWIMDYLIEESIELVGATLFFTYFAQLRMEVEERDVANTNSVVSSHSEV